MNGENKSLADLLDGAFFPEPSLFDQTRLVRADLLVSEYISTLLKHLPVATTDPDSLRMLADICRVLLKLHFKLALAIAVSEK